jgi:hypothetical protein
MAHRAVDITVRYFSGLSVRCAAAFFRSGNASRQRPFDARLMPRSAKDGAATTVPFEETWAWNTPEKEAHTQKTREQA